MTICSVPDCGLEAIQAEDTDEYCVNHLMEFRQEMMAKYREDKNKLEE